MGTVPTHELIDRLAADAAPVRRLRPPALRACLWLAGYLAVVGGLIWASNAIPAMMETLQEPRFALEIAAILLTGVGAIFAAFFLSLPDRSRLWGVLPIFPLGLWLLLSGYGCYAHWLEYGPSGWSLGQSWNCFGFIVGLGIPTGLALHAVLRRANPLDPIPVLVTGGLGAAGLTAAALQFFHPFDTTFLDLGVHIVAIVLVVAAMTLGGRAVSMPARSAPKR